MDNNKILSMVDHTLLKQEATWDDIKALIDDAIEYKTASVCIPPCYVEQAAKYANGKIKICTVIGFPNGNSTSDIKKCETIDAISNGASEIDMVINIGQLKAGNFEYVESEIRDIARACHRTPTVTGEYAILKVIIETCLLTEDEIRMMCAIVKAADADFIKTSTGFSTSGATFDAVRIMKEEIDAIGGGLEIKAAGGISSFEDAQKFIELGATRLGTSRLIKILKS